MRQLAKRILLLASGLSLAGCSVLLGLRDDYAASTGDDGGPGGEAGTGDAQVSETGAEGGADAAPDAASSCTNQKKDGKETDVDCGGDTCGPCANTKACAVDHDCTSGSCAGTGTLSCTPWIKSFGTTAGAADGFAVAVGASGDIAICGSASETLDFGNGALAANGLRDIVVAKLAPNGTARWSKRFGGADDELCSAIAIDSGGNVVIGGTYYDGAKLDLGFGALPKGGGSDAFVAKLDATSGAALWVRTVNSAGPDRVYGVAVDPNDAALATGEVGGSVTVASNAFGDSGGSADIFVLKIAAGGTFQWANGYGSASKGDDIGRAVTSDAAGNVLVTGSFRGTPLTIGSAPPLTPIGSHDAFVFELDPAGAAKWAVRYGSPSAFIASGPEEGLGIAVDPSGVFFTGRSTQNGTAQAFVAKLATDGGAVWDVVGGGPSADNGTAISLDPAGDPVVVGQFASPSFVFGSAPTLTNAGSGADGFLTKLVGLDGGVASAEGYGGTSNDFGYGVSARRGNTVIVGTSGSSTTKVRGLAAGGPIFVGSLGTLP